MKPPSPSSSKDDDDEVLGDAQGLPPLIPEGEYEGSFKRVERGYFEGLERYFLWFTISKPGQYLNVELYLSCPFPKVKGRPFSQSSKLVQAYSVACGHPPKRRDRNRMSTKVFKGKSFRFQVRTVVNSSKGKPKPLAEHYSVIDRLISVEVGK